MYRSLNLIVWGGLALILVGVIGYTTLYGPIGPQPSPTTQSPWTGAATTPTGNNTANATSPTPTTTSPAPGR